MSETVDTLRQMVEEASAHDEALVKSLRAEISRLREADKLLELTWMWPKHRVDQDALEQRVWAYFSDENR